jgi:hypothetical protein
MERTGRTESTGRTERTKEQRRRRTISPPFQPKAGPFKAVVKLSLDRLPEVTAASHVIFVHGQYRTCEEMFDIIMELYAKLFRSFFFGGGRGEREGGERS